MNEALMVDPAELVGLSEADALTLLRGKVYRVLCRDGVYDYPHTQNCFFRYNLVIENHIITEVRMF